MRLVGQPRVDRVLTSVFTIPTEEPESDGTLTWDATTMLLVELDSGGVRGLGYSYTHRSAALLVDDVLAPVVADRSPFHATRLHEDMVAAVRNYGRPGLASMAISAVDIAIHDLRARLLGAPLVAVLGQAHDSVDAYASGGFTSCSMPQLERAAQDVLERGIRAFKMKVGRELERDAERVARVRDVLGDDPELHVDANAAYEPYQAVELARRFASSGVRWFEEPVRGGHPDRLRAVRGALPPGMRLAAGEYGSEPADFRRLLEADAVDVLMPDATRCGGITGMLEAGALCAAHAVPLSAHTAPAAHLHVCCAMRATHSMELFADHVRVERLLFDGTVEPVNGRLSPDLGRPGLGVELRRRDAERFAA